MWWTRGSCSTMMRSVSNLVKLDTIGYSLKGELLLE